MSEQKYYVKLRQEVCIADQCGYGGIICHTWLSKDYDFSEELFRQAFTKSELGKIMGGVFYRTFIHQFNPELAEELYKLGYKTTQTTEEWIGARYEFDNIWEWINPLIELVPVEDNE